MESAFKNIVSEELSKVKEQSLDGDIEIPICAVMDNDILGEYDGVPTSSQSTEGECEKIMLELQSTFYEDLGEEPSTRELEEYDGTWVDKEDEYLARAVLEQMQLSDDQVHQEVWCPVYKQGKMQENHHFIYCTLCGLQLIRGNEDHLAKAHTEHLDRGCKSTPKFRMESGFDIMALYMHCQACKTFEIFL